MLQISFFFQADDTKWITTHSFQSQSGQGILFQLFGGLVTRATHEIDSPLNFVNGVY